MSKTLNNRLTVLAVDIKAVHLAIRASAEQIADQAMAAGNLLIEAKASVRHGGWREWLDKNVGMSERTAQRYMQLARSGMKSATVADLGIRAAAEALMARTPEMEGEATQDNIIDFVTMWHCMLYSWARLPVKDRAKVRMKAVTQFASSAKSLQLVPVYLRNTEDLEGLMAAGKFNPFEMPDGDELFPHVRQALVEMWGEDAR